MNRLAFMNYDMARRLMLLLVLAGVAAPVLAAAAGGEANLEWGMMTVELFGGLAIFLFGMTQMEEGLKAVAGERMKNILATLTTNRFMGVFTGALVTAVIQSSSVTTVLVVGFISAGLMSLAQSVGVIMGANIGTTITAQIVAFKITKAALLLIAVGFALLFLSKDEKTRHYGGMTMGLGMVFFGMHVMGEAMQPLRSFEPFLDLMKTMDNPLIGVLVAAVFTAIIQSSSAATAIVIVMAAQGFISLEAGIALAFGSNIGTCATALLAVIGKPREAVRAALVHLSFNTLGVLIWLPFIGFIANLVTAISPSYPELRGTALLAAETPRQIANAHTFFNVANTMIFIWFTSQFVRLVEWLVPDKPMEEEGVIVRAKYLEETLLSAPPASPPPGGSSGPSQPPSPGTPPAGGAPAPSALPREESGAPTAVSAVPVPSAPMPEVPIVTMTPAATPPVPAPRPVALEVPPVASLAQVASVPVVEAQAVAPPVMAEPEVSQAPGEVGPPPEEPRKRSPTEPMGVASATATARNKRAAPARKPSLPKAAGVVGPPPQEAASTGPTGSRANATATAPKKVTAPAKKPSVPKAAPVQKKAPRRGIRLKTDVGDEPDYD